MSIFKFTVASPTLLLLAVTVLHSDQEAALSSANMAQLKQRVPRLRRVIRYNPRAGKAYQVNPADSFSSFSEGLFV